MRKEIVNHIKNEIYFSLLDANSKISIEISRLKIECTCWIELIQEVAGSAVDLSHQLFRLICKSHQRQWLETNFCLSRYNQTVVFRSPFSKWRRGRLNLLRQVAIYYSRARRRNVFEDLIPSSCLATLFPSIQTNRDMQTVRSHVATVTGLDDTQKNWGTSLMGEDKCRFERRIKLDNQPHEWSFCSFSFYTRRFANDKDGRVEGVQGDLIISIIKLGKMTIYFFYQRFMLMKLF